MPLGFDFDGHRLLIAATSDQGTRAIYYYDPDTEQLGELVASHSHFDIIPEGVHAAIDGVSLAGPILSELAETVIGIRYITDGPRVKWFDRTMAELQGVVDAALPNTVNLMASRSRDERRLLILAFSDRDPGTYYLLDLTAEQPALARLGAFLPEVPVAQMAPMHAIDYRARDGERIHGYLTLPLGEKTKGLPLIVMPHGGPLVRDIWGYHPHVQFLANRGYAVLQMNFRGSPGYGAAFHQKGKREIGRAMQTDIEDGTRWAIEAGIADPRRIGIAGASYGGFAVLFALAHSPELYRCGVSFAGVTDWAAISKQRRGEEYKYAYAHFKEWIGDPKLDGPFLDSISPVNLAGKIVAPVLIFQGREDRTVPPRQAREMVAALKKAGRPPRAIYFPKEGHGLKEVKSRVTFFRELERFLGEHLPP